MSPAVLAGRLTGLLRRVPVTAVLVVAVTVGAFWGTETTLGTGARSLGDGRWWTVVTAALTVATPGGTLVTLLLVAALLGPVEHRWGSRWAASALVLGQVAAGLVGAGASALLAATGDRWGAQLAGALVVGPLPGVLATVAAASAAATPLLRRRVRVVLGVGLVMLVLYGGTGGDVHRLAGWVVGLLAGELAVRLRGRHVERGPVSRRESRALVALVVAAAAIGPLVAALARTSSGPWSVLSHLFVSGTPDAGTLRQLCGTGTQLADCRVLTGRSHMVGLGPTLLSALPVLVQLVLAEGLRRGRRAAWVGAVLFTGLLTVVGGAVVAAVLTDPEAALTALGTPRGGLPVVAVWAPLSAPVAVLVLLLVTRNRFPVPAAPGTARRWALLAGGGLAVVVLAYVGAGLVLRGEWSQPPTVGRLLLDLPARMLPPGWLGEVLPQLAPLHGAARVLANWTGVACWAVLVGSAWIVVRPAVPSGDAARARALVDRHGDGALSFMTTWVGNRWWFTEDGVDGRAVVAFRVVGGVALTTGDPVGPPDARARAVPEFTAWCVARGWTPCWYSVTDRVVEALPGARRVQVASETWLPLGQLAFTGKKWQDVRTAVNRAARDDVRAVWLRWAEAPLVLREQVARSSEEWLAGKGLPEMGFTLGGLDELEDPAVRCLLSVGPDGRVHGVTSWLPASRDGVRVGWTLDLMRRSPGCPPGTMEFLVGTAALTFQEEGAEFVSLSGAPLAFPAGSADDGPEGGSDGDALARLLEATGRLMEPVYGFRSLLSFKAKFQPRHRPLWLVHLDNADLPRIARAVSQAYLPHLSPAQALRLGRAVLVGRRPRRPTAAPAAPSPSELVGSGSR